MVESTNPSEKHVEDQAKEQTGHRQVRLRVDERDMKSAYANAVRTNATAEEVMLDFGVNAVNPAAPQDQPEIIFKISDRIVMNYYSAKRFAIMLSQTIRQYEDQFGALELDVVKRRKN